MGIIGSQIKPFTATAFKAGEDFYDVTDEDVKGKWAVFFFYPADFTFVCPTELENLGEQYSMLQKMDVEVYAVSTDTHFSHKAWHDTSEKIGKLNFPFLGDQNHVLARNFDVLREGVGLADRATFVVDPDGVIQIMEQTCEGVGRNANELARKIKAAHYFDLTARFNVSDNLTFTATVQNLLDNQPTIVGSDIGSTAYNSGNIYPSTYDALGRRYAAAVKLRF